MPLPSRAILFGLCLVTAFAGGYGLYERQRRLRLETEHTERLRQQLARAEERAREAEERARDLQAQLEASASEKDAANAAAGGDPAVEAPGGAPEAAPTPPVAGLPDFGGRGGALFALMEDPGFVKLWTAQQRAQLDGRYADLFKRLNLSPAQMERFKDLLVEKQSAVREVLAAARAQGLNPRENRAELRQLVEQTNAEVDANIRATLGSDAYSQYQFYEQTGAQRGVVNQLDRRLSYSGGGLNDTQADQLVRILAEAAPPQNANQNPVRRPGGGRVTITDDVIARASTVLSPSQVRALQQLQNEQQVQSQLNQILRDTRRRRPPPRPGS